MKLMFWFLFATCFILPAQLIATSEICDNAIDDDGDGLIDQNDDDCFCKIAEAVSLIPNPSFEDQNCCPTNRSQMNCANTWIQASAPTTDYIHNCGWLGWENLPMPLPIPDGEGALGFRDGRFSMGNNNNGGNIGNNLNTGDNSNPNWKEYAGACLLSPLRKGVAYKFKFFIGFTEQPHSPPINISFFGTEDCENLPFGNGDETFGCPTNGPGWTQLGAVSTFGTSEWKELEINVTPPTDIYAITIGPACRERNTQFNPYYFFDNLVLAEQSAFEFDIKANAHPCSSNLSFELPQYDTLNYQWYKDGIALKGETNSQLLEPPEEGIYSVVFTSEFGCTVTKPFDYKIPVLKTTIVRNICEGESLFFANQQLNKSGIYWDTLTSVHGCDSLIQLELKVDKAVEESVKVKLFPNEHYKIGNFKFGQSGKYSQTINSSYGCDSTVHLSLSYYSIFAPNIFSPNGDGLNDIFTISGGTDLAEVKSVKVYDRWGNLSYSQDASAKSAGWNGLIGNKEAPNGVYLYIANLLMDDNIPREFSGMVTLLR